MARKPMLVLVVLCSLAAFPQQASQVQPRQFDGASWWEHVKVLAADNMEGRETGSPGLQKAEAWLVGQLKRVGLEPAGTNGYYQPVKFIQREIVEKDSSLALVKDGKAEPLVLGEEAFFGTRVDLAPEMEAPLVFVGYGLVVPEKNYDDLRAADLKGKVAVMVTGSPAELPGPLAAHASSASERWKALQQAGAVGVIAILNPASMDIPWSRMSLNRTHPSMTLAGEEFDETRGQKLSVIFNPVHAEMLFAGSGHSWDEIAALAKERKPITRFPLTVSVQAKTRMDKKEVMSSNVIAKLPGGDSKLKEQYVVMTAHIDHIGIGQPINGDRIYNGAMDNASGSSALLDIATSLKRSAKPRRSVLFTWVTGEEKGLLGSRYFAVRPTVPKQDMVAELNMDMFLPIVPLKLLTVYGLAESDLGDWARQVAETDGAQVQPDQEPQRNIFIRSDQYSFIRQGIPSLAIGVGFDQSNKQVQKDWLTHRYHAPSDDLNQPVDLATAGKYETIMRDLLLKVADSPQKPEWKTDSFFRRYSQTR
jgi:hypothetical protein